MNENNQNCSNLKSWKKLENYVKETLRIIAVTHIHTHIHTKSKTHTKESRLVQKSPLITVWGLGEY